MQYGMDVGITAVNARMQARFRGRLFAIQGVGIGINQHNVIIKQMAFVFAGHGDGNRAVRQAHGKIATGRRNPALAVDKMSGGYQLLGGMIKEIAITHGDVVGKVLENR